MNAHRHTFTTLSRPTRDQHVTWPMEPSWVDWQVLVHGGTCPRTGQPQPPLVFQYFAGHYSPARIRARAADDAERLHRKHYAIRPPERARGAA